jgi:hypothetical protein
MVTHKRRKTPQPRDSVAASRIFETGARVAYLLRESQDVVARRLPPPIHHETDDA